MEREISVQSRIQYDDFKKLIWFSVLKMGKRFKTWIIAALAAMVLAIMAIDIYLASTGRVDSILPDTILIALIPGIFYFLLNSTTKSTYRRSAHVISVEQKFTFTVQNVRIEALGDKIKGTVENAYGSFYKVFELQDAFYLFGSRQNAHVIPKRYMDKKTIAELRALLLEKLGDKFILCY